MKIHHRLGISERIMLSGLIGTLAAAAWGDRSLTSLPEAIEPRVLSEIPHPLLVPPADLRRNPRNSYTRPGSSIAILIDDHDRTLSSTERQRLQEALDQIPADALTGLPSLYISRGRSTHGFLSPLNETDLVVSLEDPSDYTEGPFAIRQAVVTAVGQYVYARRLRFRERAEWKKFFFDTSLSDQEMRSGFGKDYAVYALDSRQAFTDAIELATKAAPPGRELERMLFIAALFTEPGSPQLGLRYYKTYDTGATDIPWPPKTVACDAIHLQMGPFFFRLEGGQLTGSAYAADNRESSWMSKNAFRFKASYAPFPGPVPVPKTTLRRVRAADDR